MEIDLTLLVQEAFNLASIILVALLSYASIAVRRYFNIKADFDAGVTLKEAIEKGMDWAEMKLLGPDGKVSIHMQNYFVAMAVKYVVAQVPGKMKELGLDEKGIRNMIEARLNLDKFIAREPSAKEIEVVSPKPSMMPVTDTELPGAH